MQYRPPRGPVHTAPLRQLQEADAEPELRDGEARERIADGPPSSALQLRLLPLIEPSLHTKRSPAQ